MKKQKMNFYEAAQVANKVADRFVENEEFQLIYSAYADNYKHYSSFEEYMENYLTSYACECYMESKKSA